jgi:tRNA uridine 5-carboxymethylaminomethyl modification enzyme
MELGRETAVRPDQANPILVAAGGKGITEPTRAHVLARRPGVALGPLLGTVEPLDDELTRWAEIEFKYEGYLTREREAADRLGELEDFVLPEELAYGEITTISIEAREKLGRIRPQTLGQAGRVPGISPSDLHSLVTRVARLRKD